MRLRRTATLVVVALLVWAVGPLALLAAVALLAVPRVRAWLRPTWRVVAGWAVAVALVVGLVVALPDGRLPIPPGTGALTSPGYLGRPHTAQPIGLDVPQHPRLAANGTGTAHLDGWSSGAHPGPGPLGESPEVDTAWYGGSCATLALDSRERLVAVCGAADGRVLRVLDPASMHPLDTVALPGPAAEECAAAPVFLDDQDRAVTVTGGREVVAVTTSDGRGEPDLTVQSSYDVGEAVPDGDCVVALLPDWDGRTWFGTAEGRVGFVDPGTGGVQVVELGAGITTSFSTGADGGVLVVTDEALHRLEVDPAGRPQVAWRADYDRGTGRKGGQDTRGSGTPPTLLPSGLVAIADNAEPRMNVRFYTADEGRLVCQRSVFADGESATDGALVAVGDRAVVVTSTAGSTGPLSTVLGRTTPGGLARVEVVDGECQVVWSTEQVAPGAGATASLATGLVYVPTKRRSLLGVSAWYLTALDARTGRTAFSARLGLGSAFGHDRAQAPVTLGPDASAYVLTRAGLVRLRDRR